MKRKTKFAPISKQYFFFKELLEDLIITISDEIVHDGGLDNDKISELIYTARQYSNRRNKYLKTSEATKGKK
jgi:hypothetical protein